MAGKPEKRPVLVHPALIRSRHAQNGDSGKHRGEEYEIGVTACPAAIVAAPVEVVWGNLVQWERHFEWADVQVERTEPEGPATVGQTISFAGKAFGCTLHFIFKVKEVNSETHQLSLHAFFPLGLQEKAHIACSPLDATSCRVQYG